MIVKSLTSRASRFGSLINYLTKDKSKLTSDRGEKFELHFNINERNQKRMVKEFEMNEQNRIHKRSNNIKMEQTVLAFSDLDRGKITPQILNDLVSEYLNKRSPLIQAYAVGHFNEAHYHVHIVSSPVELFTGRNLRMNHSEFAALKREIQEYQIEKYPELSNSVVRHGKKKELEKQLSIKDKEFRLNQNPNKTSDKAQAKEAIEYCLAMAESKEHYFELLNEAGFTPYMRGNDFKGITDGNRKYRFATLVDDYAEQLTNLEVKQERIEELSDIRQDNSQIREPEQEVEIDYESANGVVEDDPSLDANDYYSYYNEIPPEA
jgi:hypothetical protein